MKYKYLFLLLAVVLSFNFVVAAPPFQSIVTSDYGLEIEANNQNYLQQNSYHNFRFRVYNATNNDFKDSTQVECSLGIIDDHGEVVFSKALVTEINYVFSVNISAGNFSELGIYHKGINCESLEGIGGGVLTQSFEITESGVGDNTNAPIFQGILLLIIFGTSCFLMFLSKEMKEPAFKIFFLITALIFLMATMLTGYMVSTDINVSSNISTTTLALVVVLGVIIFLVFIYFMIGQTVSALDMLKIKKGLKMSNNVGSGSKVAGYNNRRAY